MTMARTTSTPSPLDTAVANVRSWEAEASAAADAVTRWEAERPDSPADSPRIAQERVTSRERVRVAADALQAARDAETAIRRAIVAREADDLQPAIDEARAALDAHNTETERILEILRQHTGQAWTTLSLGRAWSPIVGTAGSAPFRDALAAAEGQQGALRDAARGQEPSLPVEELPASLRVGGVLPVRAAIAQHEQDAAARAEADHRAVEQAELDAAAETIGSDITRSAMRDRWNPLRPMYENGRPTDEELGEFSRSVLSKVPDGVTDAQRDALLVIARLVGTKAAQCIIDHLRAVAVAGARAPRSGSWPPILDKI